VGATTRTGGISHGAQVEPSPRRVDHGWNLLDDLCAPKGESFGWMKTVGGFRKTRVRGLKRVNCAGYLVGAAYNLVRLARLASLATTA
jgi:Transposase DDE domain